MVYSYQYQHTPILMIKRLHVFTVYELYELLWLFTSVYASILSQYGK